MVESLHYKDIINKARHHKDKSNKIDYCCNERERENIAEKNKK